MLPPEDRARMDWVHWFGAAAPLAVLVSLGSLAMLFLVLRPGKPAATSRERVEVQMAVLGPPTGHEIAMLVVLGLTVVGFVVGPMLGLDPGTAAILGFMGAVISGNFDRRALQELDWNFLLFNGVVLSIAGLVVSLGLDKAAAAAVGPQMARIGNDVLVFVLVVACLNLVARL